MRASCAAICSAIERNCSSLPLMWLFKRAIMCLAALMRSELHLDNQSATFTWNDYLSQGIPFCGSKRSQNRVVMLICALDFSVCENGQLRKLGLSRRVLIRNGLGEQNTLRCDTPEGVSGKRYLKTTQLANSNWQLTRLGPETTRKRDFDR